MVKQTSKIGPGCMNFKSENFGKNSSEFFVELASGHLGKSENMSQKHFRPFSHESNFGSQSISRGRNFNGPTVLCQLYGKSGHVVQQCYHRFDIHYTGDNPNYSVQNLTTLQTLPSQLSPETQNHTSQPSYYISPSLLPSYNLNNY